MTKSLILVPRPAPHLPQTVTFLRNAGFTSLLPLASSHPQGLPAALPPAATALILTSPFAIPAMAGSSLPVWCVGPATAAAAQKAGLAVTYAGASNAEALATHIATLPLPPQHFVHGHGDHAHMQWHSLLQGAGHTVTPLLVYQNQPIATLPDEILPSLPRVTHTLLFSAGSAKHLAKLLKQANISSSGTAIALSREVATAAQSLARWPRVVAAAAPTLQAMAAVLKKEGGTP